MPSLPLLAPRTTDHEAPARGERGPYRPPQWGLPPLWMAIRQESVGAGVVGRQVAGGVAAGGVTFIVQNLCRRHIDVLPAGLAETISQVDVLHVHEIALVEARHLIECGAPQQKARAGQPADRPFAGLEPFLAVLRSPGIGLPQRADHGVHAAADEARQVPRRRVDRAVGSWSSGPRAPAR